MVDIKEGEMGRWIFYISTFTVVNDLCREWKEYNVYQQKIGEEVDTFRHHYMGLICWFIWTPLASTPIWLKQRVDAAIYWLLPYPSWLPSTLHSYSTPHTVPSSGVGLYLDLARIALFFGSPAFESIDEVDSIESLFTTGTQIDEVSVFITWFTVEVL